MTRKRFVKLLMACGWSRDRAQELARNVADGGYSYAAEMQDLVDFYRFLCDAFTEAVVSPPASDLMFTVTMPCEYAETTFEVIL